MPLQQADFPGIAGVDGWLGWDWLRPAAADRPTTSSFGAGSGPASAILTRRSAEPTSGPAERRNLVLSPAALLVVPGHRNHWYSRNALFARFGSTNVRQG